jgi:serine/threonine protein kinase
MEYLETGDLFAYLYQKPLPPLPEAEAKEIAYQILDGMCMMHENGFAHRDLKPNVGLLFECGRGEFTKANV